MSASGENLDLNLSLKPLLSKMYMEMHSLSPPPLVATPFSTLPPTLLPPANTFQFTADKLVNDYKIGLMTRNSRSVLLKPPLVPHTDAVRVFILIICAGFWMVPFVTSVLFICVCLRSEELVIDTLNLILLLEFIFLCFHLTDTLDDLLFIVLFNLLY